LHSLEAALLQQECYKGVFWLERSVSAEFWAVAAGAGGVT